MSKLTIFTAPKPFTDPHIRLIQRNAIQTWLHLGPDVEVILVGEEHGLAETAAEFDVKLLADVRRNAFGTPLISSIFHLAREASQSPVLAYVNADILIMPDFVNAALEVQQKHEKYLIVGQRWDLDVREALTFPENWVELLKKRADQTGRLHPRGGSDYFIYPRDSFKDIPDFAVGRAGWDNWMFYKARYEGWPLIDGTQSIQIIHQDHDYRHLPKGQPHYRLPETTDNIQLAGGPRTIFNLLDADRELVDGEVQKINLSWEKRWREVEIFPLVRLRSMLLGQLFFGVFHPVKAYREIRAWLGKKIKHQKSQA